MWHFKRAFQNTFIDQILTIRTKTRVILRKKMSPSSNWLTQRQTDGRMDGATDRQTEGWTNGWMNGRTDGWRVGWTDGRTDGWTDARRDTGTDGWTDGRTHRRTDERRDRRTDGWTGGKVFSHSYFCDQHILLKFQPDSQSRNFVRWDRYFAVLDKNFFYLIKNSIMNFTVFIYRHDKFKIDYISESGQLKRIHKSSLVFLLIRPIKWNLLNTTAEIPQCINRCNSQYYFLRFVWKLMN